MKGLQQTTLLVAICSTFVVGCATDPHSGQPSLKETFASDDPCSSNARNIGIALGALTGAIIGNQVNHSNTSRVTGAAAGAAIGGLIGANMDKRRCELYKIAKAHQLDMQFEDIKTNSANNDSTGMAITIQDNSRQFLSGSDQLTPEALSYFKQIADQYSYAQQKKQLANTSNSNEIAAVEALKTRKILLVGHTDDTGGSKLNADLSERRANAVARLFKDSGVPESNLYFQGAGETLPVADNRTEEGRAKNRRVEIVEVTDETALHGYLAQRAPILAYYRNTEPTPHTDGVKEEKKATVVTSKKPKTHSKLAKTTWPTSQPQASQNNTTSIDFGGTTNIKNVTVDIGEISSSKTGWSLISSSYANDTPISSTCVEDRPRIANSVKSLKNNQKLSTSDYLPGLYETSWSDKVNGHLIALTNVAVLRDGATLPNLPDLYIYQDYKTGNKYTYKSTPKVNAYHGSKATLYRVFNEEGPVQCIDMVIPNK